MKCFDIVVNGYPRSGKDHFFKFIAEVLAEHKIMCNLLSSVGPVVESMKVMGVSLDKVPKDDKFRQFATGIKILWDDLYDGSTEFLLNESKNFHYTQSLYSEPVVASVFVTMIREGKNIAKFTKRSPNPVISIIVDKKSCSENIACEADEKVYEYTYDFMIDSNGDLEDYKKNCKRWAQEIFIKELLHET